MIEKTYFNQTLKKGKLGEDIAVRYLTAIGYDVESVANDSQYFADDIDLLATTAEHKMKVEVKADYKTHQTGNICIEVIGNREKNKLGWLNYCKADNVFFVDMTTQEIHCVRLAELKEYYETNKDKIKHLVRKQLENGSYYKTAEIALIPVAELKQFPHYVLLNAENTANI